MFANGICRDIVLASSHIYGCGLSGDGDDGDNDDEDDDDDDDDGDEDDDARSYVLNSLADYVVVPPISSRSTAPKIFVTLAFSVTNL